MEIKTRLNTVDYGNSELNRDSKNESFDNPNLIHSPLPRWHATCNSRTPAALAHTSCRCASAHFISTPCDILKDHVCTCCRSSLIPIILHNTSSDAADSSEVK